MQQNEAEANESAFLLVDLQAPIPLRPSVYCVKLQAFRSQCTYNLEFYCFQGAIDIGISHLMYSK
jgi:hypothetical protein